MATSARLDELKKRFDENPRRYFAPLANEYRKLGDLTQAVALCRAHLPNQPGHISGHIVLAQALYEARELGEARAIFEAALDLDPENLIALRYLGDIAREQGEPLQARGWYERVLDADPRNDEIALLLRELESSDALAAAAAPVQAAPSAVEEFEPPAAASSYVIDANMVDLALDLPSEPPPALSLMGTLDSTLDIVAPAPAPARDEIERADAPAAGLHVTVPEQSAPEPSLAGDAPTVPATYDASDDPFFGSSTHELPLAMGELEAVAEPSVDDWFGTPSPVPEAAQSIAAPDLGGEFDDSFFPDLSEATPVATPAVPAPEAAMPDGSAAVDVQAPTPPFVRVDDAPPASIPTPPFLAALELDVPEAAGADSAPVAEGDDRLDGEAASVDWHSAPTPVDAPAVASWDGERAGAAGETVAATPEGERLDQLELESFAEEDVATPEVIAASAPEAWGDVPILDVAGRWGVEPDTFEDAVPDARAPLEEPSPAAADQLEIPTFRPTDDVAEWTLDAPDAVPPELVVAAESPLSTDEILPTSGAVSEFETEDTLAAYAREAATAAAPDGFVLEESSFVPPAHDDTPFIASALSLAIDTPDAYTVGAPELSAHEPFPMEAERPLEQPAAPAPSSEWREVVSDGEAAYDTPPSVFGGSIDDFESSPMDEAVGASASIDHGETDETGMDRVEPIAGLVPRESPPDETAFEPAPAEESAVAPVGDESPAFVTETMAELYLQQGFHDEALSIYRQLLSQHPDDPALRDRVAALERGASSAVVERLVPRDAVDRAGQSVRAFFQHFARREPRQRGAQQEGGDDAESGDPHAAASPGAEARAATFSGVATRDEALTVPDVPATVGASPSAGAPSSLTDLFAAGTVSGADERAATALSSAFGGGESSPTAGEGAPRDGELSLEHLFRDVPARSSGAVTLDEFYEGSSPEGSDTGSPQGDGGTERDADIEQFTAWLEGLKKK